MATSSTLIVQSQELNPVRVATDTNLAGLYYNGESNNGIGATLIYSFAPPPLVIDSVTLKIGDRILLTNQTNAYENGIYDLVAEDELTTTLRRADDFNSPLNMTPTHTIKTQDGSVHKGISWIVTAPGVNQVGVDGITFQRGGAGVKAGLTDVFGGGGAGNFFTAIGVVTGDIVVVSFVSKTNDVTLDSVAVSDDTLNVTFSADPGPNTQLSFIAVTP